MRNLSDAVSAVKADGRHQQIRCPAHDDNKASLSIDAGTHGGVVLKCHAGCDTRAVLEAGGLAMTDLRPDGAPSSLPIDATYSYRDECGDELYQVLRLVPKSFRQRRSDGAGGWVWQLNGVRRVLYRLPHLVGQSTVWMVEGEKDADRLADAGLASTTWAGGASAWRRDYAAQLKTAGVQTLIIVPDNDTAGRKCARGIEADAIAAGMSARMVELPGLPSKGDVSDWLNAGHTIAELVALTTQTSDANAALRTAITPHNAVAAWGLSANDRMKPYSTHANIGIALDHMPELLRDAHYDQFLDKTLIDGREWRDDDDTGICMYLQERVGLTGATPGMVNAVLAHRLRATPRHCVKDYLASLRWDHESRILHALEDGWGVEPASAQSSDYIRAVSANFLIGMVARIMRPGCQLDTMVIFEGAQGVGKSSALRVLGGAWYMAATESVASKDFQQSFRGAWLIEIGELDAFSKADRDRVKFIISNPVDKYRASYARHAQDYPRQCVFAGTTNHDDWGNDDTGLRRFHPIRCGDIDLDLIAAHRDQWFAEAVYLLEHGATWWEVPQDAARVAQANRQAEDIWTATVLDHLIGKSDVALADVLRDALKIRDADMTRIHELRAGRILKLAGWVKKDSRRGPKVTKRWFSPE